ncbi:hypothetical protein SUDANB105_06604 [Streptomyces sp. enrichment culture]|uniref:DUF2511 domain-containing protein n=1 Tax=Streptomyces sp. enrichment culture TaxID=1795815 RepID=UPI003F556C0B
MTQDPGCPPSTRTSDRIRPDHTRGPDGARGTAPSGPRALVGVALIVCCLVTACGGSGRSDPATTDPEPLPSPTSATQEISEKNLGYTWPLTVDHGTAECRGDNEAVFTAPDGTTYALNDRARDAGYRSIEPLRAAGDDGDPISLGSLLTKTLKLCQAAG